MKLFGIHRWAGLAIAAMILGAPLAAAAQNAAVNAPATNAAASNATSATNSATNTAAATPAAPANETTQTYPKDNNNSGDDAWMLTSSVLVLMMTIPGLALFYAGMVRKKNVLATLAQSFGATAVITVLWMIIGYSLAFRGSGKFIGVGNGDPNCQESDKEPRRSLFNGLAQIIVQSTKQPGEIHVEVFKEGWDGAELTPAKLTVTTKRVTLRPQVAVDRGA